MKQADGWLLSAFSCSQAFILEVEVSPTRLKGQKLLAQGSALGYYG